MDVSGSGTGSTSLIGASLEELAQTGRSSVPTILTECIAWVRASGALDRPGLFRGSGDTERMAKIVAAFEQQPREPHRVLEKADPADEDVCSVIKMFLRSLKEPLMTYALFDEWVAASQAANASERLTIVLGRLSNVHREVTRSLMAFLKELTVHGESNGLSTQTLANVFGPVVLRPPLTITDFERHRPPAVRLVQVLLDNYAAVFMHSLSRSSDTTTQTSTATELSPRRSRKAEQQRRTEGLDEFSSLAKLVAASGMTGPAAPTKTPEDSEEDMPESSSGEDDDEESVAPRLAMMGRATIRIKQGGSAVGPKRQQSPPPQEAATAQPGTSNEASLTDVDTRMLQEHINQLREMPLTPAQKVVEEAEEKEDTPAERAAKVELIRKMLRDDPRFKSQTRSATAKYEPAVVMPPARRKKTRRKPRKKEGEGDSTGGSVMPPTESSGGRGSAALLPPPPLPVGDSAAAAKKRRPKACGKCKEPVRGTKVNALGEAWHPACFVCAECDEQLATFFECNGQPFCDKHIQAAEEKAFGIVNERGQALCGRCKLVVDTGTVVTALGKKWHSACFVCSTCDCALETYFGAAGKPYCEQHVQQATAPSQSSSSSSVAPAANGSSQATPGAGEAAVRRKKKKKASIRPRRALSNPLTIPKGDIKMPDKICRGCALDFASRPTVTEEKCARCHAEKCSACGSLQQPTSLQGKPEFVCNVCVAKDVKTSAPSQKHSDDSSSVLASASESRVSTPAPAAAVLVAPEPIRSTRGATESLLSPRKVAETHLGRSGSFIESPRRLAEAKRSTRTSSGALAASMGSDSPRRVGSGRSSSSGITIPVIAEVSPRLASRTSSELSAAPQALESPHSPRKGSGVLVLSPRPEFSRFPRKQDYITFLEKSKKRAVKRYAVLQDQVLWFFKDEVSAKKGKDPMEVLDLTRLKKLTRLGVHQEKPFCLALTVEYDTYVVWTEQLEYSNWADAIVDSGPEGVIIGTMDE